MRSAALAILVLAIAPATVAAKRAPAVDPTGMRGLGTATRVIEISTTTTATTRATARTYQVRAGKWRIKRRAMSARVGVNGLSWPKRRHAGDGTTPIGNYGFVYDFGSRRDPGVTGLKWRKLVPGSCWAGGRASYNRWVHRVPCGPIDENLWSSAGVAYRYASVIDFNYHEPVYGRGSGIFLHEQTGRATAGCVSLKEADLLAVLRWMRPGTRILIGPATWLRSLKR